MENENKIQKEFQAPNIKTFADDMAEAIEQDQEGAVRKIIHEQEIKEKEKMNVSPDSRRNKLFMLGSTLLIVAACTALFFFVYKKGPTTVPVQPQFSSIIYADKTAFLDVGDLEKDKIFALIRSEINYGTVKDDGVEGIYLTQNKQIIGLRKFFELTKSSFVSGDIYFVSDNFLLGAVNKETKAPFILIKMRSIPDVFDNMRNWEPKMFSELSPLFGLTLNQDTNYLLSKNFEDKVIDNKNTRVLYDKEGKIVMMYAYLDETSLLITNSESAVTEIFQRILSSRIRK
jgi:hypothetical protein